MVPVLGKLTALLLVCMHKMGQLSDIIWLLWIWKAPFMNSSGILAILMVFHGL